MKDNQYNSDKAIEDSYTILRILKSLFINVRNVHVNACGHEVVGKITKITSRTFILSILELKAFDCTQMTLHFTLLDGTMYFVELPVFSIQGQDVELELPQCIWQKQERKEQRTSVHSNVQVSCTVLPVLKQRNCAHHPGFERFIPNANVLEELKQELPDIKKVIDSVLCELKKLVSIVHVNFYSGGALLPRREHIVKSCKQSLYISNVLEQESYLAVHKQNDVISALPMLHKLRAQNLDDAVVRSYLMQVMKEDAALSLSAYVCAPLCLAAECVGVLFVGAAQESRHFKFRAVDIEGIQACAAMISEVIWKRKIESIPKHEWGTQMLDISLNGMLLQVSSTIMRFLYSGMKMKLLCTMPPHTLSIMAEVIHVNREESRFGVKFVDVSSDVQSKLKYYVAQSLVNS